MGTILLVDDDPQFVGEAGKMLTEAGYRVLEAPDGVRALRILEQMREGIDLAIVDLALPEINGFELIGNLRRRPNSVKVLAVSSVYRDSHLESTTALGAHAALRKPAGHRHLPRQKWLQTVRELIGKP